MHDQVPDDDPITVDRRPPETVFGLLGDELRVGILRALADAHGEPLTFSALREAVGERDSGKFNYHLRKLDGVFVERRDDGYELTIAGQQLVGALVAGTYTADASIEPIEVDDPCPNCGQVPLVVTYEADYARLACPACGDWYNEFAFPPGTLDQYAPEELPAAFDRWMYSLFERIDAGFCATCAGRLSGSLDLDRDTPSVRWTCERCGDEARASVAMPALVHPVTRAFCLDHGRDPRATPSWRLATTEEVTIEADADGAIVTLAIDGESVTAEVGPDGRVTAVDRSDR